MRWALALLIFGGVWILWWSNDEERRVEPTVKSERRLLDAGWRLMPEKEMTIGEMERYAGGLSDKKLWEKLEKNFEEWMGENDEREWCYQPRLAIMLAREVGRRDGEAGMKELAGWLEEVEAGLDFYSGRDSKVQWQFFELRVRMAGFAGWVSGKPEEAVERLIESGRYGEEDWPVVNEGYLMYIKHSEFFAMEEVLRDGFRQIAESDLGKARDLFAEGTGVWAFDANEVIESLLAEVAQEQWSVFMNGLQESIDRKYGERKEDGTFDSLGSLLRKGDWISGYPELFRQEETSGGSRNDSLWAPARGRSEDAVLALQDERISAEKKKWLFVGMAMADSGYYDLLEHLPDEQKVSVINMVPSFWEYNFGPITGRENPGALDLERLREVVMETKMTEEVRVKIFELLENWTE